MGMQRKYFRMAIFTICFIIMNRTYDFVLKIEIFRYFND